MFSASYRLVPQAAAQLACPLLQPWGQATIKQASRGWAWVVKSEGFYKETQLGQGMGDITSGCLQGVQSLEVD
jgi:hypothetical protein